jgi:CTP:molybdopterin cytidylyltransferase MocA
VVRPGFAWPGAPGFLRIVENPFHIEGMGASLRVGAAALRPGLDAIALGLGDLPWLHDTTVSAALAAWGEQGGVLVPTYEGRRGHPVVVPGRLREALLGARGDEGARALFGGDVMTLWQTTDPGTVTDVDTPGDLRLASAGAA